MYATVAFTSQEAEERALLPAAAVLRLHDADWVFVPAGDRRFRRVQIKAGAQTADGLQQVMSGLRAGDRVVANALQMSSVSEQ